MGIKVRGQDLATIEQVGLQLADNLVNVEGVKASAVFADRIVGKPYLLIDIDREKINRYGLQIAQVQLQIQATIGGMTMTNTVEGRERYPIRIRYPLDYRSDVDRIKNIFLQTPSNGQIRLGDVVNIRYEQGPQAIKSEDGFLIGYVLFDKEDGYAEVDVVNNAQDHFSDLIEKGDLAIPTGINYVFAGNYEQQVRANKRLGLVVPIALALIFLILYLQFRSVTIALMVFSGVFVAFAGGFIMIQLYGSPTFMDFDFFGTNIRDRFQIRAINLSVAVWVGFLALFGIATDDGVLVATFLRDSFKRNTPDSIAGIRDAVVEGGQRRVRPAMMTTATTILALLPVLTSTGRGSDIMIPMAIPSFGGMTLQVITMFTVPVLFCLWKEINFKSKNMWPKSNNGSTGTMKVVTIVLLLIMSGSTQAQSVHELIDWAKDHNPGLKALDLEYQAAYKIKDQKGDYPDPKVSLGLGVLPVETRLGAQRIKLGVTQMIPWKGLLDARVDLASAQAEIKQSMRDVKSIDIEYAIRTAYSALIFLEERKGLIDDRLEVLDILEELAKSAVRSGKGKLSNVLFIQRSRESMEEEKLLLEKQKEQPTIMINRWTGRRLDSNIDVVYDAGSSMNVNVLADSIGDEPQFRILENRILASEKAISLTRFEEKPKIGVGLDYAIIDARNDVSIPRNGRDILMPMGSITIPLNKGRFQAKRAEEKIKQDAIQALADDMREMFNAELTQAHSQVELADLRINKSNKLKLITRETLNLMRTEYASEGSRFEELLRLEMELIDYDMEIIKAEYQKELAYAIIYKYR
jgi:Cu(I)/Ag(I) efflux system membrane protein CusA/SilA